MLPLAVLITIVSILVGGLWARRRSGQPIDTPFTTTLTLMASGAGTAIVAGGLALWVVIARAIHGGTIDSNLPPGMSEDALLGLVVVGALITIVRAVSSLIDHVRS